MKPLSAGPQAPSSSAGLAEGASLHRFACAASGLAFLVLIAGGMVTSTGSGLAVPDWPLSFGTLFPRMVGGVRFEHGHRLIAGTVALLTWALAWGLWKKDERPWVRGLGLAAAAGVLLQALLGGLTVLLKLPAPVSIAHACLGQAVFCLLLAAAQATSPWFRAPAERTGGALWRLGAAAAALAYLQLFLGAVVRHTGLGLAYHAAGAAAVAAAVLVLAGATLRRAAYEPALRRPALLLALLLPLQLGLGAASYLVRYTAGLDLGFYQASSLVTAHVACGALMLGAAVIYTLRARKLRTA